MSHSCDEWSRWLRSVQLETPFFYATPGVTYQDLNYLRMLERRDRGHEGNELDRTRIAVPSAEQISWSIGTQGTDPTDLSDDSGPSSTLPLREAIRQSLQGLAGIYRLADLYREQTDDGIVLMCAARELLPELADMLHPANHRQYSEPIHNVGGEQLARQLAWFQRAGALALPAVRLPPSLPPSLPADEPPFDHACVQGGVVHEYAGVTDGCLCLIAFDDAQAAARFLETVVPSTDDVTVEPDRVLVNLSFTVQGLQACALPQTHLEALPQEFRQGMAARAGLLGDVRTNHPRHWTLPSMNWPQALQGPHAEAPRGAACVALDTVHAVLQLRVRASESTRAGLQGAVGLLAQALNERVGTLAGVRPLSVQWMRRIEQEGKAVDHFGFTDGQSQPQLKRDNSMQVFDNQVQLGEVLAGYDNAADHARDLAINQNPDSRRLLHGGSYLVVRKLRQNVPALNTAVRRAVEAEAAVATAAAGGPSLSEHDVLAHMMGRWPASAGAGKAGMPLAQVGATPNDFSYEDDPTGEQCPLGAHIRRAHPRDAVAPRFPSRVPGGRAPRIMRRGMTYGPALAPDHANVDAERGLMFMAYNASIAEQFEPVQRWLAGGNSAGGYSGTACPFLGVPEAGRRRNFRFEHGGRTIHMHVDGDDDLCVEPQPLVTLQWGLYALTPSKAGIEYLKAQATAACVDVAWSAAAGVRQIERLHSLQAERGAAAAALAWKAALEDTEALSDYRSASLWAAVREHHGGVLRVPYGVLVASRRGIDAVLANRDAHYTVAGYQDRLNDSIGPIFLGMDADDPDYLRQSERCNAAIEQLSASDGFAAARRAAQGSLKALMDHSIGLAAAQQEPGWELTVDVRDLVDGTLAGLCEQWFGLAQDAETGLFARGSFDWSWQPGMPVYYPGHFTAVSRATFQPAPSDAVMALAAEHGRALSTAMLQFLHTRGHSITAPITRAVLDDLWANSPQTAARTIVGALMGFLPTTDGVLRRVLLEWARDGTLMALRSRLGAGKLDHWADARSLLDGPLRQMMKLRPVPEQIWRTVSRAHVLGEIGQSRVPVEPGDKIILGLVSATQEDLAKGEVHDVFPVFGGARSAVEHPPTHACPGYMAAMGVMVGMLSALLDVNALLKPGPAPGILVYSGDVPVKPGAKPQHRGNDKFMLADLWVAPRGEVIGYGDSWAYNRWAVGLGYSHFAHELDKLGFDTRRFADHAQATRQLSDMWANDHDRPSDRKTIYFHLRQRVSAYAGDPLRQPLPIAILVSAGGNDVKDAPPSQPDRFGCADTGTDSPLDRMVADFGESPPIIEARLLEFLSDMQSKLADVLRRLHVAASDPVSKKQLIPIIVHAYDHPFPDGRPSGFAIATCAPLRPTFTRKRYPELATGAQPGALQVMRILIERLNEAYAWTVDDLARREGIDVHFARLAGMLETQVDFPAAGYGAYWENELHPSVKGFAVLARELARLIAGLQAR